MRVSEVVLVALVGDTLRRYLVDERIGQIALDAASRFDKRRRKAGKRPVFDEVVECDTCLGQWAMFAAVVLCRFLPPVGVAVAANGAVAYRLKGWLR